MCSTKSKQVDFVAVFACSLRLVCQFLPSSLKLHSAQAVVSQHTYVAFLTCLGLTLTKHNSESFKSMFCLSVTSAKRKTEPRLIHRLDVVSVCKGQINSSTSKKRTKVMFIECANWQNSTSASLLNKRLISA